MNVIFYDPYVLDGKDQSGRVCAYRVLEELAAHVQTWLVLHTPLTPETDCMINGEAIACMKRMLF